MVNELDSKSRGSVPTSGHSNLEIDPRCRERFLPMPRGGLLHTQGIAFAGLSDLRHHYRVERSGYARHVLGFTLSGRGMTQGADHAFTAGPGVLTVKPAGFSYRSMLDPSRRSRHWSTAWFHLEDRPRWSALRLSGVSNFPSRHGKAISMIMEEYAALASARADRSGPEPHPLAECMARVLLDYLDEEVRHLGGKQDDGHWEMGRLWTLVGRDLSHEWRIPELASRLSMSPRHFIRQCLKLLGARPHRILTEMRVEQAKELLKDEQYTLEAVAVRVGFSTPFAFSNTFKRVTGLRPSVWRNGAGAGSRAPHASKSSTTSTHAP